MTTIASLPSVGLFTLLRAFFKAAGPADAPADLQTTFRLDGIDTASLARYNALLGFAPGALPVTYYYLPVQRAHLATMLGQAFPFRLMGMIHVENEIVEHRRPDLDLPLVLATTVHIEPPAANGARYCVLRTQGVQHGATVFECRSRYLAQRGARRAEGERADVDEAMGMAVLGGWSLAADAGRQYAAVSGDWNPIHLWRWSARLLGMRSPIIHGMHTVARACAQLEQARGRRMTSISAIFKAPIAMGSSVDLLADGSTGNYRVVCGGKSAVVGGVA